MNIQYEGNNFSEFIEKLKKINIPEIYIEFVEDTVYCNLPGKFLFINEFYSTFQKKGFGTKALKKITKLADEYKINLFLFPYGTSKYFFLKFDFEEKFKKYSGLFESLKLFRFFKGYEEEHFNYLKKNKFKKNFKDIFDPTKLYAIDFFCSGGGMTFGFKKAGIDVIAGIDIDINCKKTYELNNPNSYFLNKDIFEYNQSDLVKDLDLPCSNNLVFIGCSPCQYWSLINNKKENSRKGKGLLIEFARFVKRYNPAYVVIENVPNIINNFEESGLTSFINFLKRNKYEVKYNIYKLSEYGVPQTRKRFSLIASRVNSNKIEPLKSNTILTVYDYIGTHNGFPKVSAGNKDDTSFQHITAGLSEENLKLVKDTPKNSKKSLKKRKYYSGKGFKDSYSRMIWSELSPTITTKFFSISNGRFIHPEENRGISIREGATLQTFPKEYIFYGTSITNLAKMIGNAVPPEFARRIAIELIKNFKEYLNYEENN